MLFNSFEFIFAFLPIFFIGLLIFARWNAFAVLPWLIAASLFFYAWWDARYLLLLAISIAGNFTFARFIVARRGTPSARGLLTAALAANLAALFFYKYFDFFVRTTNAVANTEWPVLGLILPLGISFFTFTQIAYLVDASRGEVSEVRWPAYLLFVLYFPHLIAGPILHHKEMMPQFAAIKYYRVQWSDLGAGLAMFVIGLGKKVLVADALAVYASPLFNAAAEGASPLLISAWAGALAYALQLYFDFSGYCDMAAGISLAMGIRLPVNFNSPYKAASLIEFWRRWHMTLSRFLRDYLYIPLGGNRRGPARRQLNLFATMLLGGLWHGANWTFVVWGALHGVGLVINHAWRTFAERRGLQSGAAIRGAGWMLTMLVVVVSWVIFRADSLAAAGRILRGMIGANGIGLPARLEAWDRASGGILARHGAVFSGVQIDRDLVGWLVFGTVLLALPNSNELLARYSPVIGAPAPERAALRLQWSWGICAAIAFATCLLLMGRKSEFLYFQF